MNKKLIGIFLFAMGLSSVGCDLKNGGSGNNTPTSSASGFSLGSNLPDGPQKSPPDHYFCSLICNSQNSDDCQAELARGAWPEIQSGDDANRIPDYTYDEAGNYFYVAFYDQGTVTCQKIGKPCDSGIPAGPELPQQNSQSGQATAGYFELAGISYSCNVSCRDQSSQECLAAQAQEPWEIQWTSAPGQITEGWTYTTQAYSYDYNLGQGTVLCKMTTVKAQSVCMQVPNFSAQ